MSPVVQPIDLNPHYLSEVLHILDLLVPNIEVCVFGSRARWTAKPYSDLDLVLMTSKPLSLEKCSELREAFDESTLPIKVDFVDWSALSETFKQIINAGKVSLRKPSMSRERDYWPVLPLEEALAALLDYRRKAPEKTNHGVPLVTAKIIKNGRIAPPDEFIEQGSYDEWMRQGLPKAGDVVLTTEAPLGEVAQLGVERVALAERVIVLRGKAEFLDNTYLRYLLQTKEMREQLAARATGTTRLGIKPSELRKINIRVPPLAFQQNVSSVLHALDDRIDLLRQINVTLESIVQALRKSQFIDSGPVDLPCLGSFSKVFYSVRKRIAANDEQAKTLADLRDTLLPRLISGRLVKKLS